MSNELASPLSAILKCAAKLPATTGESARFRARHSTAGTVRVILCDVSSSMNDRAGARRRIDHLREALNQVSRPEHKIIAFSSSARIIERADDLPAPSGGTALEIGFAEAALYNPRATLVISDGEPNSPDAALAAADQLSGTIDVIYCGNESNRDAVEFMRRLARAGCGQYAGHSWVRQGAPQLAETMQRLMLTDRMGQQP